MTNYCLSCVCATYFCSKLGSNWFEPIQKCEPYKCSQTSTIQFHHVFSLVVKLVKNTAEQTDWCIICSSCCKHNTRLSEACQKMHNKSCFKKFVFNVGSQKAIQQIKPTLEEAKCSRNKNCCANYECIFIWWWQTRVKRSQRIQTLWTKDQI